MQHKSKKQGIVLITTMLSVVLVVMLLSAVVYSNMGSLRLTSNFYDRETALMAADSGVQYAVTRLQKDITWRGVDKYSLTFSKTKGLLQVEEENGNVIGIVNLANGRRAAFRIKFNCEDGDSGLDGMKNSSNPLDLVNVSTNNLFSTSSAYAVIADKDGKVAVKNGTPVEVKFSGDGYCCTYPFTIPKQTCRLVVQGLAGTAVRDAVPSDLYRLDNLKGNVTPVCAECYAAVDTDTLSDESVACAAADIKINGEEKLIITRNDKSDDPTKMSSMGNIALKAKNKKSVNFQNGDVSVGSTKEYTINGETQNSNTFNKDSMTTLAWDDIPKAEQNENKLKGGCYVWGKDADGKPCLKYYSSFTTENGKPVVSGNPSETYTSNCTLGGDSKISVDIENHTMYFNGNTYVDGPFNVMSEGNDTRPIVGFTYQGKDKQNILTTTGSVYIQGTTLGAGAITSEGNITIQGTSVIESNPTMGVSTYSKGDINITAIEGTTKSAEKAKKNSGCGSVNTGNTEQRVAGRDIIQAQATPPLTPGTREQFDDAYRTQLFAYLQNSPYNCTYTQYVAMCMYMAMYMDIKDGDPYNYLEYYHSPSAENFLTDRFNDLMNYSNLNSQIASDVREITLTTYTTYQSYLNGTVTQLDFFNVGPGESEIDVDVMANDKVMNKIYGNAAVNPQHYANLNTKFNGKLQYKDVDLTGVIYACGNINIDTGGNVLNVTGNMVAYGGDPDKQNPGENGGTITLNAKNVGLSYDPTYLNNLLNMTKHRKLKKGMYCTY